jgi:hypothetical protein
MKDIHPLPEALEGPEPNKRFQPVFAATPFEQRKTYPGEGEVLKDDDDGWDRS